MALELGDITVADMATGRKLIVKADGKVTDMEGDRPMSEEGTSFYRQFLERKARAWSEGYAAGWKDRECDFPPHTSENPWQKLLDNDKARL